MNLRAHESPAHAAHATHAARILAPLAAALLALLALATPAHGAVPAGVPADDAIGSATAITDFEALPLPALSAPERTSSAPEPWNADPTSCFQHSSQACGGFVDPARRSTWGAVKLHYR